MNENMLTNNSHICNETEIGGQMIAVCVVVYGEMNSGTANNIDRANDTQSSKTANERCE